MSTGRPLSDPKADFARERRRRALASISARLRSEPDDVSSMLPFEEVVAALGRRSEADLGVQTIPLDPSSARSTAAAANSTAPSAPRHRRCAGAGSRSPPHAAAERRYRRSTSTESRISTSCRTATTASPSRERSATRRSRRFREEYEPVVQALYDAGTGGRGSETERYLRLAMLRYLLLHTHEWTDDMLERLLDDPRPPSAEDDTMVHQLLKEIRDTESAVRSVATSAATSRSSIASIPSRFPLVLDDMDA
jgi:hypothetical protein